MAANYTYGYTVSIQGNDYEPDYGWSDEHYHLKDVPFDSYEEACEFLRSITPEQALDWERQTECNGLDIIILVDFILPDGTHDYSHGFTMIGECEWIGDKCNCIDVWEPVKD